MGDLVKTLRLELESDLPGEEAQFLMAPEARPRGRPTTDSDQVCLQSAVLLYLFPHRDDWRLVLMKRTDYGGIHSGQVSIPGGRLEASESHLQAALREFMEETGVQVNDSQVLGCLSELFIPPSRFLVKPFVAYALDRPRFDPDPAEVDEIIEMPVSSLISDMTVKTGRVRQSSGSWVDTPYFDAGGHMVWGATAMILSELKEILRRNVQVLS